MRDMYMTFKRGWRDGAAGWAKDPRLTSHRELGPLYERAYADGYRACGEAMRRFCDDIGYEPSPFRSADAPGAGKPEEPR